MAATLQIVEQAMEGIPGLRITSTYRDPEHNRSVGGSPTSYHMRRSDPAVDVSGPQESLDRLATRLASLGHDAELLWQSPGHYDHVHYALRDGASPGTGTPQFSDRGDAERPQGYQSPTTSAVAQFMSNLNPLQAPEVSDATSRQQRAGSLLSSRTRMVTVGDQQDSTVTESREGSVDAPRARRPARPKSAAERLRERPRVGG